MKHAGRITAGLAAVIAISVTACNGDGTSGGEGGASSTTTSGGPTTSSSTTTSGSATSTSSGMAACVGTKTGLVCAISADCTPTSHCFKGDCYENANGNPCKEDSDCMSTNCTLECCQGNAPGDPCTYDAQCSSLGCRPDTHTCA